MVDRTGKRVEEMIVQRLGLCLMNRKRLSQSVARKFLITNSFAAQAEQERKILQGELLRQQQDFREVHQQNLTEMKEFQKFQNFYLR